VDKFKAIDSFLAVSRAGNFARAASELGVSRAMISKRIAQLEERLGVRLFNRTTRQLSLTKAGQDYADVCLDALKAFDIGEEKLRRLEREPTGVLRIVSSRSFGLMHTTHAVADFARKYPNVQIELEFKANSRTAVRLAEHAFDVNIRLTPPPPQSRLVARRLAEFEWLLCATPAYLSGKPLPRKLEDLQSHRCVANPRSGNEWRFTLAGKPQVQRITPVLSVSRTSALYAVTLLDAGIARLPSYCVAKDIREGRLVRVLSQYAMDGGSVYAMYQRSKFKSAKISLFVEFLERRFKAAF
jgi:DNA-binding transcriptional LysR family regulator